MRARNTDSSTAAARVPQHPRVRVGDRNRRAVQCARVLRASARPRGFHNACVPPRARCRRQPHSAAGTLRLSSALSLRSHQLATSQAARICWTLFLRFFQHRQILTGELLTSKIDVPIVQSHWKALNTFILYYALGFPLRA